jgi:hypothetical protein
VRRRLFLVLGFVGGGVVATALVRRAGGRRRERIDLYFDDGSMLSLVEDSPGAAELLPTARFIVNAARGVR